MKKLGEMRIWERAGTDFSERSNVAAALIGKPSGVKCQLSISNW